MACRADTGCCRPWSARFVECAAQLCRNCRCSCWDCWRCLRLPGPRFRLAHLDGKRVGSIGALESATEHAKLTPAMARRYHNHRIPPGMACVRRLPQAS
ncbi:hypothetical protein DI041_02775 [Stenotrophomonas maltophilia]|nr:hypothetical protein DI034_16710 [Stenotrophomonas maltophilia]TIE64946.1 hypothetical protein DI041_02775 [Stenotrophomonas maltophilia]